MSLSFIISCYVCVFFICVLFAMVDYRIEVKLDMLVLQELGRNFEKISWSKLRVRIRIVIAKDFLDMFPEQVLEFSSISDGVHNVDVWIKTKRNCL